MAKTIERSREEVLPDGEYEGDSPLPSGIPFLGMVREAGAITAGVFPVKPPKQWFVNPRLAKLSGLEVGGDGRVFGHIASWAQSHIGMAGSVKAPKSKSGYAYFRTGLVETDSGEMVEVGQITLTGGHAPLSADPGSAVKHYDDTSSAIMDVNIGEDRHGIWVAGALRPSVSDEQIRTIRASSVSGDWRPINGALELVAVCAVNVPGFPIPRARVAGGAPVALVAAGTAELVEVALLDTADSVEAQVARLEGLTEDELVALSELEDLLGAKSAEPSEDESVEDRLERLERQVLGEAAERRRQLDRAVIAAAAELAKVGPPRRQRTRTQAARDARIAALRARVASGSLSGSESVEGDPADSDSRAEQLRRRVMGTEPPVEVSAEDRVAQLRSRVGLDDGEWEDGMDISFTTVDAVAAAARMRVSGAVVGTATKSWNREKRDKAAEKGQAMSDGSYPIKDCADVAKAVKAIGRGKKSHASIKAHIKKRAKALGCTGKLPDDWK